MFNPSANEAISTLFNFAYRQVLTSGSPLLCIVGKYFTFLRSNYNRNAVALIVYKAECAGNS